MIGATEPTGIWAALWRRVAPLVRIEDLVLAAWVAFTAPLLAQQGGGGPFDGGRPIQGLFAVVGVIGAAACLAIPPSDQPEGAAVGASSATIGPLSGGMILVAASGLSGLDAPESLIGPLAVVSAVGILIARWRLRALSTQTRRALVVPYVLAAGGIFWQLMDAVVGPIQSNGSLRDAVLSGVPGAGTVAGFLLAFSAIYYAMLVYAPRQVAEHEGGPVAWIARYGLFAAGIALGMSWLTAFGT
jgi:hypothetical protein